MKALLAGLVIAALIAITVADIEEYSEDAVNTINTVANLYDDEWETELINSNTRLEFTLQEEPQEDGMIMEMTSIVERAPPEEDTICGDWIGVKLDQGRDFLCNISHFVVEVGYDILGDGVHNMQIEVVLESELSDHVLLSVSVLRIPSTVDPGNMMTWARQNRVGVISPVSVDQLNQFHGSQQLTLDFTWLRELLRFGMKLSRQKRTVADGREIDVYILRPLLLSDDIINKLWEEVDWFQYDEGSENTDVLSQLDGLALRN